VRQHLFESSRESGSEKRIRSTGKNSRPTGAGAISASATRIDAARLRHSVRGAYRTRIEYLAADSVSLIASLVFFFGQTRPGHELFPMSAEKASKKSGRTLWKTTLARQR